MFTRRTPFGVPSGMPSPSAMTTRLVPLTNGVKLTQPWPALAPGSAVSMTNFLPVEGHLLPRSRLSSINTQRVNAGDNMRWIGVLPSAAAASPKIWGSANTQHYLFSSNGSISVASFVSSFGIGSADLQTNTIWRYAPTYSATLDENMLLATGSSFDTILCLYSDSVSGQPRYSYLTSAPKTVAIGVFDSYVVAFNVQGDANSVTRVQWCQRGSPSNWTGEGSGFEDLLSARGAGSAVRDLGDGRMILFTDVETWYGVAAAYPAQFLFYPLDRAVGCQWPSSIQECSEGLLFVGSDFHLRLLPRGGGLSRIVCPDIAPLIRNHTNNEVDGYANYTWGLFDPRLRVYYLFLAPGAGPQYKVLAIHLDTEAWGFVDYYNQVIAGVTINDARNTMTKHEGLFFLSGSGFTLCSTSSVGPEFGSTVTATWRSAPIASDLPGSYKQVTGIAIDYRSESSSTVTLKISGDGGRTYGSGRAIALGGDSTDNGLGPNFVRRASADLYSGGALPVLELTSTYTATIDRIDLTLQIQGRTQ